MTSDDLHTLIKNSNESQWIKQDKKIISKNNLSVSITKKEPYLRNKDMELSGPQWNDFFDRFNSDQIINIVVSFNDQPIITYNWLYAAEVVIPLPIAANMIDEFYLPENDIALLLSDNSSQFIKLMNSSKTRAFTS